MMAIYAQEDAVANSNRAFHTVTPERALPWAADVAELIDDLAGEKLPAALMDPVLDERRARHAERHAAAARKAAALERIPELEPRIAQLGADELDELEQLAVVGHGDYTAAAFALRGEVRARRQQLADEAAGTPGSGDAGEDEPADDKSATTSAVEPAAEDPDAELGAEDADVELGAEDADVDEAAAAADDSDAEQQNA